MTIGDDRGRLRISDADREAAAKRLHTAMAEGRITATELEERLGVVYSAKTFAELEPPLADLPGPGLIAPLGVVPGRESVHLRTEMGTIKRSGAWPVPPRLKLTTSMGSIHLNLTESNPLPNRIDIDVATGMGSVTIVVPRGTTADVDGVKASWGTVHSKVPPVPAGTGPHLVVVGTVGMGTLTIRPARRKFREWLNG